MRDTDGLEPSPPADGAADARSRLARRMRRLIRAVAYAVRRLEMRADLQFGKTEALAQASPEVPLPPIFVGGTGRSGTTITARILGCHPAYHMIRFEIWFLTLPGGLSDLLNGQTDFYLFAWRVKHRWSVSASAAGNRGLVSEERQRAALVELRDGLHTDPDGAAKRFVHRLLDPAAAAAGASGWIEMTPTNVRSAPVLARLWPESKLIHSVRDGRDVSCSVTPLVWGPDTLEASLRWWADALGLAFDACARSPEGFVHTLRMESLVATDREGELARLLAFVGLLETPEIRAFFDGSATAKRANLGRWRRDVAADQASAFLALHADLTARLIANGYPYRPYEQEPTGLPTAAEALIAG